MSFSFDKFYIWTRVRKNQNTGAYLPEKVSSEIKS